MYLQEQIEMLKRRIEELEEIIERNKKEMWRLGLINEQIQETQNLLEEAIENFEENEQENQENMDLFEARN